MSKCSDCTHYEPIDEENGNCFGQEVSGGMDSSECPANAFKAKEKQ